MAKPALKSREEMSADLRASGFDESRTRGLIQTVADTVAGLDLLTRSEWKQQLDLDRERRQALLDRLASAEKLNQERHQMLLNRLADFDRQSRERDEALLDRLTDFDKQSRERDEMLLTRTVKLEEVCRNIFLWIRWGFGIFATLLLFLVSGLI